MTQATELTNVTTVLLARMESHPQDFAAGGRFYYIAEELATRVYETDHISRFLRALPKVDQEALVETWRKKIYAGFEKDVMELVFDDEYEKREEEKAKRLMGAQRVPIQGWIDPRLSSPQAMNAAQGQIQAANSAGSVGHGFLSGLFGGR